MIFIQGKYSGRTICNYIDTVDSINYIVVVADADADAVGAF